MRLCLSCCRARLASSCNGNARPWRVCALLSKPNSIVTCRMKKSRRLSADVSKQTHDRKINESNRHEHKPSLVLSESRFVYVHPVDIRDFKNLSSSLFFIHTIHVRKKIYVPIQLYPAESTQDWVNIMYITQLSIYFISWSNSLYCLNFTSVTLIRCNSCSAIVSGAGEEQEDMCRKYPWKHRSSCIQTGWLLTHQQLKIHQSAVTLERFY